MEIKTKEQLFATETLEDIDRLCWERIDKGETKYGTWLAFLDRDCYTHMEEELLDFINYAKFQIIKLRMLRMKKDDSNK